MNKDLGNYVARYEEIQKEYLAIKEEVKMEVLRAETLASLPKEEIVRKLNYSILNSNQTTIVKEIQGIINAEDDIKKVFDVFKVHFYDAKDIVFDDLKTMFPFWISVVLEGRRSLYISCYKLFLEKIIQQFRFDEIVKSNRILIANFISEIEEHFEKINKKLYPEANISKLKKIKENTINEVNRLDVAKLNPNSLKVIKNKYLRQVKGVKTFAQIKRAKRRRITAIIIAILVVIAVVLIGFIPRVDYRIVSFGNIQSNIYNFKNELRDYHDYDDEDMALYEPAGYYNYQTVAEVVGVRGLIWESFFSPSKLEIDNEYEGYRVASIANNAFRDLDSLEEIVLSNNIAYIGSDAFKNCTNLTTVKTNEKQQLPNELIAIGKTAFENTKIEKVRVFSTIEVMYNDSFDSKTTVLSENQSSYFDAICIGRPQFKTSFAEVKIVVVDTLENDKKPPFDSHSEVFVPGGSTQFKIHSLPHHMGYELDGFTFYGKDELVADEFGVYEGEPVTETIYLFAKYTIIEYSLDLVFNGGTEISYPDVFTVEKPYSLPEITRTGYTFEGWYSSPTYATNKKCTSTSGIYNDVKLYAKFTPNKYEITYFQDSFDLTLDYNYEGSTNKVYNVTSAQTITYPVPTRSGYIFTGWYTDEDCTEYFDTDTVIYENTTLYAGWKSLASGYGTNIIDPSDYTSSNVYSHYISSSSSSYNEYYIYFRINETGTYNMYYTTQSNNSNYGVYWGLYNVTSGTTIRSTSRTYGSSYSSLSFTANAGDVIRINAFDCYYNTYFYFYFSGMHSDGDIQLGEAVQTVTYDKDFEISYKEKQGYTFEGYYTDKNGTGTQITDSEGKSLNAYNYPKDIQVYPYYKCITYDITYDLDGGSTTEDFVDTYTIITPTITLPTLTKTGYSFEGWYVNDTEDVINEIELGSYGELNLTAKFIPNTYTVRYPSYNVTVTYDYNYSGSTPTEVTYDLGDTIEYPTNPTRSGYIFAGWYTESTCDNKYYFDSDIDEDITLYARWTTYSSSYNGWNVSGSTFTSTGKSHYGSYSLSITAPCKVTVSFNYSVSSESGCDYLTIYNNGTQVDRISGYVTNKSYSCTLEAGQSIAFNYSKDVSVSRDDDCGTIYNFSMTSAETITPSGIVHASRELSVTFNETFYVPVHERSGYTFKGYYTGENGTGTKITDETGASLVPYNFTSDIELYAYYE